MSVTTTSGGSAATAASRSSPFSACATTVNPESFSTRTTPSRSSSESSATATRIACVAERAASRPIGSSEGRTRITGTESRMPLSRVSPRSS